MHPLESEQREALPRLLVGGTAPGLSPAPGAPLLTHTDGRLLRSVHIVDERAVERTIEVPVERPLAVLADGQPITTLLTLGANPTWLVLGYLWTHGLITDLTELRAVTVDWEQGVAHVETAAGGGLGGRTGGQLPGVQGRIGTAQDGGLLRTELLRPLALPPARVTRATLLAVIQGAATLGPLFRAAGAVHGCALFAGSQMWLAAEDVSRRNAIDTIIGGMVLHGITGAGKILFMTGRHTVEVVMKAASCGVPVLVSRKGLTATSQELAQHLGILLVGRATPGHYVCFAGAARIDS